MCVAARALNFYSNPTTPLSHLCDCTTSTAASLCKLHMRAIMSVSCMLRITMYNLTVFVIVYQFILLLNCTIFERILKYLNISYFQIYFYELSNFQLYKAYIIDSLTLTIASTCDFKIET